MKGKLLLILVLISIKVSGQSIVQTIENKVHFQESLNVLHHELHFQYKNTDTVCGYEIRLFSNEKSGSCQFAVIFVKGKYSINSLINANLLNWLEKNWEKYFYITGTIRNEISCCLLANIDTFYYCNDEKLYNRNNFLNDNCKPIYYGNTNIFFSISYVESIVDNFTSSNVQYAENYYHFMPIKDSLKEIKYLHYRKVLKRKYIGVNVIFNQKKIKNVKTECYIMSY